MSLENCTPFMSAIPAADSGSDDTGRAANITIGTARQATLNNNVRLMDAFR
jgi:hypothetical protein